MKMVCAAAPYRTLHFAIKEGAEEVAGIEQKVDE